MRKKEKEGTHECGKEHYDSYPRKLIFRSGGEWMERNGIHNDVCVEYKHQDEKQAIGPALRVFHVYREAEIRVKNERNNAEYYFSIGNSGGGRHEQLLFLIIPSKKKALRFLRPRGFYSFYFLFSVVTNHLDSFQYPLYALS